MATPKIPIVRGQYPIPYGGLVSRKKKIRIARSSSSQNISSNSMIKYILEKNNSNEDEGYGEDEYVVEKIISHRNRPKGGCQYFLKWKDYPDTENTWEDEENVYATELLEAYWRDKPTASSSSKSSANGKSNGRQAKRCASSNSKKSSLPSSRTVFQSNGIATNSLSEPTSALVKYNRSLKRNSKNVKNDQKPRLRLKVNNSSSMIKANRNENHPSSGRITRDIYESVKSTVVDNHKEDSSSESEPSSDSDATIKDIMEIDEEEEQSDDEFLLAQQNENEKEQDANKDSKLKSLNAKLGPRKPKSHNEKESIYDDRGLKSIIRNIDENWDPYVEEVIAIEPHDKYPNVLWIYISWRSGFTSVHLNTEVNKLCPLSIIQFYEKRIVSKDSPNYNYKI